MPDPRPPPRLAGAPGAVAVTCPDCGTRNMPVNVERYGARCIRCWVRWMQWAYPEDWRERMKR